MSWRKYFTPATTKNSNLSVISGTNSLSNPGPAKTNYSSYLPDVYTGSPNRIDRYQQYEVMDSDPEINAALDILAEFCTQKLKDGKSPFTVKWRNKATNSEIRILAEYLQQWNKLQQFDTRIFRIVRNTFKYGDSFFIRDPETQKWHWIDPSKIVKIIVNESDGKAPEQYVVKDLAPNFENLVVTQITPNINPRQTGGGISSSPGYFGATGMQKGAGGPYPSSSSGSRFGLSETEYAIDSEHMVHLSLSEGLDNNYPFGNSLLENIFKVYKQKELLEDAILIYRIQRAPERRVFHIDVGNMPSHMAMAFVERVKNEVHQRRIPSQSGGGSNVIDSAYNPMSVNEDFYFPKTCLSLNEKIKLLDDRNLALIDIIQEFEQGKENFVYTVNQITHEIEPGKIVWAGITRKNTQLVEVLLDNGQKIKVTPDHRFILRDGSEKEAQHLLTSDSLMPLYLHDGRTGKHQGADKYLRYTCNMNGKKKWVHTMVCSKSVPGKETEIHHIDCNSRNNNPTNLIEMTTLEHRKLHSSLGTYHMTLAWNDEEKRAKIVNGIRKYHANATAEDKEMFKERGRKNGAKTWLKKENKEKILAALQRNHIEVPKRKTIQYNEAMGFRLIELYDLGYNSISKITTVLRNDNIFQEEFKKANQFLLRDKNRPFKLLPTDKTLHKIVQTIGYDNWSNFKNTYKKNHKIVSITWLDITEDTGDITVDSINNNHNFALTAGVFIHNSEGRGSDVTTLPGGQNLGEIDDLRFFTNKLFRGLRIPSSYLPTGAEDSQAAFNDGRVGTAYIQELRFNKYCERLQSLITEVFDLEFKMYMYTRGLNIDANLFELQFNPPMNFASTRQATIDAERINTFNTIQAIPFMSNRFALKRFLGLTDEELAENERLWAEENGQGQPTYTDAAGELRGAGLSVAGIEGDLGMAGDLSAPEDIAGESELGGEPGTGAMPPVAPAAGTPPPM